MNTDCNNYEPKLIDYLNDELTEDLKYQIEQHVKNCEHCNALLNDYILLFETIDKQAETNPPARIEKNFETFLRIEQKKLENGKPIKTMKLSQIAIRIAAAIAILISGVLIGMQINSSKSDTIVENDALKSEMQEIKDLLMLSLQQQYSASDRIQAVNYIEDSKTVDEDLIKALINTLNTDKNVNVRITAASALKKFGSLQFVRTALLGSLDLQTDPSVQITLINILVELDEKAAIVPMQKILTNEKTHEIVKQQAQTGIAILL